MTHHSNPATRHADNLIALELIVSMPAIPAKRYPLTWFALHVAAPMSPRYITRTFGSWISPVKHEAEEDPS